MIGWQRKPTRDPSALVSSMSYAMFRAMKASSYSVLFIVRSIDSPELGRALSRCSDRQCSDYQEWGWGGRR